MTTATDRKSELMRVLDDTDRETRELLESLDDKELDKKSGESNWTVGQLAGHVAQVPWGKFVLGRLSEGRDAKAPAPLFFVRDLGNWWSVRRFKNTSQAELLETWDKAIADYKAYVGSLPDDALDRGGEVPGRGRMTAADFIRAAPVHTREHAATIRAAIGQT